MYSPESTGIRSAYRNSSPDKSALLMAESSMSCYDGVELFYTHPVQVWCERSITRYCAAIVGNRPFRYAIVLQPVL